jgi:hypothetical protein
MGMVLPTWRLIRLPAHHSQLMPLRDSCRKTVPVFIGHHARSGFAPRERHPDSAGAVIGSQILGRRAGTPIRWVA